jgi:hypothetical protein
MKCETERRGLKLRAYDLDPAQVLAANRIALFRARLSLSDNSQISNSPEYRWDRYQVLSDINLELPKIVRYVPDTGPATNAKHFDPATRR